MTGAEMETQNTNTMTNTPTAIFKGYNRNSWFYDRDGRKDYINFDEEILDMFVLPNSVHKRYALPQHRTDIVLELHIRHGCVRNGVNCLFTDQNDVSNGWINRWASQFYEGVSFRPWSTFTLGLVHQLPGLRGAENQPINLQLFYYTK